MQTQNIASASPTLFQLQDFECPLCLKLFFEPVTVPCGHNFCKFCLEQSLLEKQNCPICRTNLSFINHQNLRVNLVLHDTLCKIFPKEYQEREQEVGEEIKEFRSTKVIRKKISIGNMHCLNPPPTSNDSAWHKWKCFVRMDDLSQEEQNADFIKMVEFHLHPTFSPRTVRCRKPPFEVERLGWGWFYIRIVIHFQPKFDKQPLEHMHRLCFEGNGDVSSVEVDFKVPVQQEQQQQNHSRVPVLQPDDQPRGATAPSSSSVPQVEVIDDDDDDSDIVDDYQEVDQLDEIL